MKRQSGAINPTMIIAVIMVVVGAAIAGWVQQLRIDKIDVQLESANKALTEANSKITGLTDKNKELSDTITLIQKTAKISQEEAAKHQEDKRVLEGKLDKALAKLPAIKKEAEAENKEATERAYARGEAIFEAYCSVNEGADVCAKEKPQ